MKTRIFSLPLLLFTFIFQASGDVRSQEQQIPEIKSLPEPSPLGIKAILVPADRKKPLYPSLKEFSIFTLDINSMAMKVHQKKLMSDDKHTATHLGTLLEDMFIYETVGMDEQTMYFDKEGYVYTKTQKKGWYKTPFVYLKKMMNVPFRLSNGIFPELKLPDGKVKYYGIDVSPDMYPILEWAFKYKVVHFENVQELKKEFVECSKEGVCFKYTAVSGNDKGSYVLFDNWGRLVEIYSAGSGKIQYVYGNYSVTLPEAKLIGSW